MKRLLIASLLALFFLLFMSCEDKVKYGTLKVTNSYSSSITKVVRDSSGSATDVTGYNDLSSNETISPGSSKEFSGIPEDSYWVGMESDNGKKQIVHVRIDADSTTAITFNP